MLTTISLFLLLCYKRDKRNKIQYFCLSKYNGSSNEAQQPIDNYSIFLRELNFFSCFRLTLERINFFTDK